MIMIHSSIVFIALVVSGYLMIRKSYYEHAIIRIVFSLYYLILWIYPEIPLEVSRIVVRTMLVLLAGLEIISYVAIRYHKRKSRSAR